MIGHVLSHWRGRNVYTFTGRSGRPFASANMKLHLFDGTGVAAKAADANARRSANAAWILFIVQSHCVAHVTHRVAGDVRGLLAAVLDDVAHGRGVVLELSSPFANGLE